VNCYATQRETLRWLAPEEERLRVAPEYDFARRPHEGRLYYELHSWGITGERWAALAAMAELGLEGRPAALTSRRAKPRGRGAESPFSGPGTRI
jgi:hypothetical protein